MRKKEIQRVIYRKSGRKTAKERQRVRDGKTRRKKGKEKDRQQVIDGKTR